LIQYDQINRKHLYEEVAIQIEKMVLNETLKVGDKLPPEKNLAENFGVSRNILREALKTLKERGLIEVRTGDGVYIVKPTVDTLKDMVNRLIVLGDVSIDELFEFRLAIEVKACGLAAEKINKDEIMELEEIISLMKQDIDDVGKWAEEELQFHLLIAKASKNKLFHSFINPVSNLLFDLFLKGRQNPEAKIEGIEGHISIVECLKTRDKNLAEDAMKRHLEHSMQLIQKTENPS
jgi:GntR family transcriptional repressor for pyruvate dehydrogenase complex